MWLYLQEQCGFVAKVICSLNETYADTIVRLRLKTFQGLLCCPIRLEFLVSGQVNCLQYKGNMGIFHPYFALVLRSSQVFKVIDPSLFNFDVCRLFPGIKSKTPSILFSMARNITGVLRGVLFKGG